MMSKYYQTPLLLGFFFQALSAQNGDFSLTGKTTQVKEGTYVYLRDLVLGGNLDSAVVRNNRFEFNTELPEPLMFTMLYTRDKSQFTEIWLEDNPMTFDATAVPFKEATVEGSRNQRLFKKMKQVVYLDVLDTKKKVILQREKQFIAQHPDALVSAYILYGALSKLNQLEVANLFSTLSVEVQGSSLGQRISKHLEKDLPEVGESYADFSVPDSNGQIRRFSDLMGPELTLLQFWTSTCGGSRSMNATLVDLNKTYGREKLQIVSVSGDISKKRWAEAVRSDKLSWPQLSSLKGWSGEAFSTYGIHSTPSNFLIDRNGLIVARNLKGVELIEKIEQLLSTN